MPKTHLADPKGSGAYCRFIRNRQVSTHISEVTCLHCIKKFKGIPHLIKEE